jgi:hypothetical protein
LIFKWNLVIITRGRDKIYLVMYKISQSTQCPREIEIIDRLENVIQDYN